MGSGELVEEPDLDDILGIQSENSPKIRNPPAMIGFACDQICPIDPPTARTEDTEPIIPDTLAATTHKTPPCRSMP